MFYHAADRHPGPGVRAQDLEERAPSFELHYCLFYAPLAHVAVEVDEEDVFPGLCLHGPGLYLRKVYVPLRERREHLVKGAWGVLYGEYDRGLVAAGPSGLFLSDDEEAREIVRRVLD